MSRHGAVDVAALPPPHVTLKVRLSLRSCFGQSFSPVAKSRHTLADGSGCLSSSRMDESASRIKKRIQRPRCENHILYPSSRISGATACQLRPSGLTRKRDGWVSRSTRALLWIPSLGPPEVRAVDLISPSWGRAEADCGAMRYYSSNYLHGLSFGVPPTGRYSASHTQLPSYSTAYSQTPYF